jgi:hypothetical protein
MLILSAGPSTPRNPPNVFRTSPQELEIIDLSVEVVTKAIARPCNGFPRFNSGDVFIELGSLGAYQLHSNTLSRVSTWFDKTLTYPMKELDDGIAGRFTKRTGILVRYEMVYNSDLNTLVLAKTVSFIPTVIVFH